MTITEMISKWRIRLVDQNGRTGLEIHGKATEKQMAMLRAAKSQIIAELRRREAEQAEAAARREAERQAERQAILSGAQPIRLRFCEGEYLSDWEIVGEAVDLLQDLGLTKYVSGWGYVLIDRAKELGHEFGYQQAADLATRIKEEKAAAQAAKEAARQAKFDEARETGKPVLLKKWVTECCDPEEECSMDVHHEYAMPDGTIRHEWHHTC